MTLYATLDEAKAELKATTTADDNLLLNNLRIVSRRVDRLHQSRRPYFAPYIEQREFILDPALVNSSEYTFRFNQPLLALTAVTVAAEALTVTSQVNVWPTVQTPYHKLRLVDYESWYRFCNTTSEWPLVKITGTWGYNRDWANAWLAVTTLGAAITTTTATTLTVADIDGTNAYGWTPWISPGALLKIDDEYLEVTAVNTSTNVATVRRGVNGSTAATHLNAAPVSVYQVEEDLRQVVARQAGNMYARRGAFVQMTIDGVGTQVYPADLLPELRGVIAGYAYE